MSSHYYLYRTFLTKFFRAFRLWLLFSVQVSVWKTKSWIENYVITSLSLPLSLNFLQKTIHSYASAYLFPTLSLVLFLPYQCLIRVPSAYTYPSTPISFSRRTTNFRVGEAILVSPNLFVSQSFRKKSKHSNEEIGRRDSDTQGWTSSWGSNSEWRRRAEIH